MARTGQAAEIPVTQRVAQWVADLRFEDIPLEVIEHIKLCLLDTLGCGLFGSTLPWGRTVIEFAQTLGVGDEASVWGTPIRLPAANAALVNGTLVHSFEMDDLHALAVIHPGAEAVPAALAVSEREEKSGRPVSGKRFLTALVAGYEIGIRVGLATGHAQLRRGFHPSATTGVFCAAAAAGSILGLNGEAMQDALGIAGTQASGLMAAQYGSSVKRMHLGRSSQSGVYGADLAARGFRGIRNVLEAPYGGFFSTMIGDCSELPLVLRDLGERYELLGTGFKPYPSCGSTHTTVDALLALKENHPDLTPQSVDSITIYTTSNTRNHVGWPYVPDTVTSAQMNLGYTVAALLLDGSLTVDSFREERLTDPRILELSARVRVEVDPAFDRLGREGRHAVRVVVRLIDGRTLETSCFHAKGTSARPLTSEEVVAKFTDLASRAVGYERAVSIVETVRRLETFSEIGGLVHLLRS